MEMTAHRIVSRFETERVDELLESEERPLTERELDHLWRTERAYGEGSQHNPIDFVPARYSQDDLALTPDSHLRSSKQTGVDGAAIGSWYSSLPRSATVTPRQHPALPGVTVQKEALKVDNKPRVTKNDWFIQKVLQTHPPRPASAPTALPDLLERHPPPKAGIDAAFAPPAWVAINPANRGFIMLQKNGWREGEALGARVDDSENTTSNRQRRGLGFREHKQKPAESSTTLRLADIIDLTQDDDSDSTPSDEDNSPPRHTSSAHGTALLVPIPTILKADKQGIGMQTRRVLHKTHRLRDTAQALAMRDARTMTEKRREHLRRAETMQRQREIHGRGQRGFERAKNREAEERRRMMSYMNR